jgi:hypothetical protein
MRLVRAFAGKALPEAVPLLRRLRAMVDEAVVVAGGEVENFTTAPRRSSESPAPAGEEPTRWQCLEVD